MLRLLCPPIGRATLQEVLLHHRPGPREPYPGFVSGASESVVSFGVLQTLCSSEYPLLMFGTGSPYAASRGCKQITDQGLEQLAQIQGLQHLSLR